MSAALESLVAKQEITEVIHRYARAIDRMDEPLLRSVFHPGSRHHHFFQGPSSDTSLPSTADNPGDFVAFALGLLKTYERTHHQLGNVLIELDGETAAVAETYFTAHHRMRPVGDPLAAANACDTPMDYFVGGRYLDRFECRDGVWGITQRTGMTDWVRLEPPSSAVMSLVARETLGRREPDDLVYRLASL